MPVPVRTTLRAGGRRVHRHQVVREEIPVTGETRDWIVIGLDDGEIRLVDPDFEARWTLAPAEFAANPTLEPLSAGGVPVWGY